MKTALRIPTIVLSPLLIPLIILAQNASDTRLLLLTACGPDGRFARGVTTDQIVIRGIDASVQALALDNAPRRIVLLCDLSGSMKMTKPHWSQVLLMLKTFVNTVQHDDRISLQAFAENRQILVPLTYNFDQVVSRIDTLAVPRAGRSPLGRGVTNLYGALLELLTDDSVGLSTGDAVILVTDQTDITDRGIGDPVAAMILRGVRLFVMHAYLPDFLPAEFQRDPTRSPSSEMRGMAEATGGVAFGPWEGARTGKIDPGTAHARMLIVYSLIRSIYRVRLVTKQDVDFRKMRIELLNRNDGRKSAVLKAIYPKTRELPRLSRDTP